MVSKETQHENKMNQVTFEDVDLTEEEQVFIKSIIKNKTDLKQIMTSYKSLNQNI